MNMKFYIAPIIFASLSLAFSCKGNEKKSVNSREDKLQYVHQLNEVEIITLQRQDFARQLLSNGRLRAGKKSFLNFGTTGKVGSINYKNGQFISAGACIATLERPDLKLVNESSEIALRKAELDLHDFLAGQGYNASDTLSVPASLMVTARMKSGYATAMNNLLRARYDLSGMYLNAPFSGRVADITLKCHDYYSGNAFCTIVDDCTMDVDFTVMESEYSFLAIGLTVKIRPFADDSREYVGKIQTINPMVNDVGQIKVCASVVNDGFLIDGMNVKVIVERSIKNQLVVPRSAVVIRDNMDVLFTYTDDGKSHWKYVNILHSNGVSYSIEANKARNVELDEGEKVIVSGNLNLADKSDVVLRNR